MILILQENDGCVIDSVRSVSATTSRQRWQANIETVIREAVVRESCGYRW